MVDVEKMKEISKGLEEHFKKYKDFYNAALGEIGEMALKGDAQNERND